MFGLAPYVNACIKHRVAADAEAAHLHKIRYRGREFMVPLRVIASRCMQLPPICKTTLHAYRGLCDTGALCSRYGFAT